MPSMRVPCSLRISTSTSSPPVADTLIGANGSTSALPGPGEMLSAAGVGGAFCAGPSASTAGAQSAQRTSPRPTTPPRTPIISSVPARASTAIVRRCGDMKPLRVLSGDRNGATPVIY